ncbi:protein-L-isoaspartate(D-aspartate) O-methyltransferase [bacterium]|nr:protein-L-isoaspartate(D-aspartate) O-methyltransferase [bacterium]
MKIRISILTVVFIFGLNCCFCESGYSDGDYLKMRLEMVETQIIRRGVTDSLVLAAMMSVPRHNFVPDEFGSRSYGDYPLPIGEGQTISQPYIVALMTELLELKGDEKVLEIGTGSGYQAAVLGEIVPLVFSIEIICTLASSAEKLLDKMGYENITVKCGDGYQGWPEQAPFDAIIVTAAPDHIPLPLIDQLAEGGKLVIPVGDIYQELIVLTKVDGKVEEEKIIPVRFVPMTGEAEDKGK